MIQLDSKKEVRKLKIHKLMQASNLHAVKKVRGKEAEEERKSGNCFQGDECHELGRAAWVWALTAALSFL